jgi:hypothetical protein
MTDNRTYHSWLGDPEEVGQRLIQYADVNAYSEDEFDELVFDIESSLDWARHLYRELLEAKKEKDEEE